MTVGEWVKEAEDCLTIAGVDSPRLDAQLLIAHSLGQSRTWVLAHLTDSFEAEGLDELLTRRSQREPLAYILGWKEFYGRRFEVNRGVLVPRPETEGLVEAVLETRLSGDVKVIDVGTGSGCIAVTLKLERPGWEIEALDVSPDALEVAIQNASNLGAEVTFHSSNGFEQLPRGYTCDVVVSNPPYIARGEVLMDEVGKFEPEFALYAEENGLAFYRVLAEGGQKVRAKEVYVEIGMGMEDRVSRVFGESGWVETRRTKDLSGSVRVLGFSADRS